jgi:hypothetical protein
VGQQIGHRVIAGEDEDLLVEAIEDPRHARHDEDEPVVTIEMPPPRDGRSG